MAGSRAARIDSMRIRISLKWKTMSLLAVALLIVNSALLYYDYRLRLSEFVAQQSRDMDAKLLILQRLVERTDTRLQRIGNIVPRLVDALPEDAELLDSWRSLQLELDLQALELVGADGELRLSGLGNDSGALSPLLRQRVVAALAAEAPDRFIHCDPRCLLYALVPTLAADGEVRIMVLASALTDLVIEFASLSGSDIALLTPQDGPADANTLWANQELAALSDAPRNRAMLQALSRMVPLQELESRENWPVGEQRLRFRQLPLSDLGGPAAGSILVFEDVSRALQRIAGQLRDSLLASVGAVLVTLVLGLSILNKPMNQLWRLARALPLLAESRHAALREMIGDKHRRRRMPTEVDLLEGQAVALTFQLEELESLVRARNKALSEKIVELGRSQQLNQKILSTAPLLIMMLSGDGRIKRVNEFACTLLGFAESELLGRSFTELIAERRQRREVGNVVVDLMAGRRHVFEHTGPLRCVDGSDERITWLQTRVTAHDGVFVLCIGLPDRAEAANAAA